MYVCKCAVCKEVYICACMCSLLFVHKLAFVCDGVVFKACCYGVKQFKKSLLNDRPPAGERRPSERQRGGGKQGGG